MTRKPLTISIEKDILKEFREYCEDKAINMSKKIEKYIISELENKRKK